MSAPPAAARLVELIESARQEAERLGGNAVEIAGRLRETADSARALSGVADRPDEGLRPEELTTGNDK